MTDDTHFEFEATESEMIETTIKWMVVSGILTLISCAVLKVMFFVGYMIYKSI